MDEFKKGLKTGLPIGIGYFPVAFSFGVLCISSHMPVLLATLISLTNLTSSGQFAGVSLMLSQASYFEISLTLLLINARYFLMSLSLSQKIEEKMNTIQRMIISFIVTDETFAVASLQEGILTFPFMAGLGILPIVGWVSGTLAGELIMGFLPASVQGAMGIALYGMFLALIVPPAKTQKPILFVVLVAAAIHCILIYIPIFSFISTGFKLILATLGAAALAAQVYPHEEASV